MAGKPRDRWLIVLVAVALVAAGCASPPVADAPDPEPLDPDRELGVVDGIAADETLDITEDDGLNDTEIQRVVARSMARVEVIRERRFTHRVSVEVITREEFREDDAVRERSTGPDAEWQNQFWRALFHVDEDTDARDVLDELYVGSVQGYYDPADRRIVLVSGTDEAVRVDPNTLSHELVHALQDQYDVLGVDRSTLDRQLAGQGLVEGEANYAEQEYSDRCAAGEWECLDRPAGMGGSNGPINLGMFVTIFHPYSDGPAFVASLIERGGWDDVDAAYDDRPTSTTEIIHPETYPSFEPETVEVPDRSTDEWQRYTDLERRTDPGTVVGEAGLFATFWANGVIEGDALFSDDDPRSPYNYSHPITAGWAGDRLMPYHDGDGSFAFVFESTWETTADAREFETAYVTLLERRGADRVDDRRYRIPAERPYSGAYRVVRDGRTVTVVHAPTPADLEAVHGPAGGAAPTRATLAGAPTESGPTAAVPVLRTAAANT